MLRLTITTATFTFMWISPVNSTPGKLQPHQKHQNHVSAFQGSGILLIQNWFQLRTRFWGCIPVYKGLPLYRTDRMNTIRYAWPREPSMLGNIRRTEHLKEEDNAPPRIHTAGTQLFGVNESYFNQSANQFNAFHNNKVWEWRLLTDK